MKSNNYISYTNKLAVIVIIAAVIYSIIEIYLQITIILNTNNSRLLACATSETTILSLLLCILTSILAIKIDGTQIDHLIRQYDDLSSSSKKYCFHLAALGTILIIIAPIWNLNTVLTQYIPIINNLPFFLGLSCFGTSILIHHVIVTRYDITRISSTIITFVLLLSIICSYYDLKAITTKYSIDLQFFYTTLFWSSSHIINIMLINTILIAWMNLLKFLNNITLNNLIYLYKIGILFNIIVSLVSLLGHCKYRAESLIFQRFYANYTQNFVLLTPTILSIIQLYYLLRTKYKSNFDICSVIHYGLILSPLLFLAMNIIGLYNTSTLHKTVLSSTISVTFMIFLVISYIIRNQQQLINSKLAIIQLFAHTVICLIIVITTTKLNNNNSILEAEKNTIYILKLLETMNKVLFIYITSTIFKYKTRCS